MGQSLPRTSDTEDLDPRYSSLAALYSRDFRLVWSGGVVSQAGTQMQQAAVAWQIYLLSHSAIALGLIGLVRILPIIGFSLGGGVVADVVDRRKLLMVTQTILLTLSAVLAVLTLSHTIQLWMIYLLTALAAATVAFDNPGRQALVPNLVPARFLANALSLNSTGFQVATVVGPSLAGLLIAASGVGAVYVVDTVSYLAVLAALIAVHPPPVRGAISRVSIGAAMEGLRFVRNTPVILHLMLLDFVVTFFGSAMALLPIFARDILHVGSRGYGLLYAAPAAGAVLTGAIMTYYSGRIRAQGKVVLLAVGAYALCTICFGLSRVFVLSLLFLAGTGAADTVSMILRQTIRQSRTPDALRGRMVSVNMIFFMGGPQLGELEAGIVARAFGSPASVVLGGIGALAATLVFGLATSTIRNVQDASR